MFFCCGMTWNGDWRPCFFIQPLMRVGGKNGESLLVEWQNMAAVHHSMSICEKLCYVTICLRLYACCCVTILLQAHSRKQALLAKLLTLMNIKKQKIKPLGKVMEIKSQSRVGGNMQFHSHKNKAIILGRNTIQYNTLFVGQGWVGVGGRWVGVGGGWLVEWSNDKTLVKLVTHFLMYHQFKHTCEQNLICQLMFWDLLQIFDCLVVLVTFSLYVSLTAVVKGRTFTYSSGYVVALRLWRVPRIYRGKNRINYQMLVN